MVGSHVGHDCKVGNHIVFANNAVLGGHVSVGDNVVFGGGAAVRQFVRIGDGAMIVGLERRARRRYSLWHGAGAARRSGRAQRRRHAPARLSKADIHRVRAAYQALFFGDGEFRARLDASPPNSPPIRWWPR